MLSSLISWLGRPAPRPRTRLAVEPLEDRTTPTTISISDATAIEGGGALKLLDRFIPEGSGGLLRPNGLVFGPDGNGDGTQDLYVTSPGSNAILRYDSATGAFIDTFVPSGSGGLDTPISLAFGPDGNLYVSSEFTGNVFRYSASGAFLDVPVSGLPSGSGMGLGLTFGADGRLYIANSGADEVLRYDGSTLSVFVSAGSGGLDRPRNAVFGPDGNLYVASPDSKQVLRYNGQTGAFIDVFATNFNPERAGPAWVQFGTDGYLYTTARTASTGVETSIVRYNAATGAFVDRFDLGRDGWSFVLGPGNVVYNSTNGAGSFVERFGSSSLASFTVTLDAPSASPVTVDFTTASGSALSDSDFAAATGTLTFAPGQTTRTVLVQTLNDTTAEATETFTLTLSNPVGATIADGIGVGTITDDDVTKFFVVNDGSPDQTYRYGAPGNGLGNSTLDSGNTAPRGAASTAAGDRVWVVDANKRVSVYDAGGGLLGSWTAGGLNAQAQVEGITTNGTDVWLVDAKQDRVYRYTGAATRLTGSQNAASSFALNSGNRSPKDLVTDGVSIWVVNDEATDKVFKYTLAGSLLGSWTMTGGGGSPTGITLDPTGASQDLWIVDNATDRVYQYAAARSLTAGTASASSTFALAAGNTNPQGIADPPPPAVGPGDRATVPSDPAMTDPAPADEATSPAGVGADTAGRGRPATPLSPDGPGPVTPGDPGGPARANNPGLDADEFGRRLAGDHGNTGAPEAAAPAVAWPPVAGTSVWPVGLPPTSVRPAGPARAAEAVNSGGDERPAGGLRTPGDGDSDLPSWRSGPPAADDQTGLLWGIELDPAAG